LHEIVGRLLGGPADPDLLVGFDTADDAGVYRIAPDTALVQTVDFITPVVDDPFVFGQVAAANALSDVWAMGGRPVTALNICCFPAKGIDRRHLAAVLEGADERVRAAGAVTLGGHSVTDAEMKFGLSVTGLVHPDRVLTNAGVRAGDALVLTKPIGTGVIIAAARKGKAPEALLARCVERMIALNDTACRLGLAHGAHAATDITGFGFAGHALEVAKASKTGLRFRFSAIPRYDESLELIGRGLTTANTPLNRQICEPWLRFTGAFTREEETLLFDPQTSGGLLMAMPADAAQDCAAALRAAGVPGAAVVGEAVVSDVPFIEFVR
jgi:selenide,water dikinase